MAAPKKIKIAMAKRRDYFVIFLALARVKNI